MDQKRRCHSVIRQNKDNANSKQWHTEASTLWQNKENKIKRPEEEALTSFTSTPLRCSEDSRLISKGALETVLMGRPLLSHCGLHTLEGHKVATVQIMGLVHYLKVTNANIRLVYIER